MAWRVLAPLLSKHSRICRFPFGGRGICCYPKTFLDPNSPRTTFRLLRSPCDNGESDFHSPSFSYRQLQIIHFIGGNLLSPTVTPREPESLEQTGLAASTVEQTILRILYFRGELYGRDLSNAIGLRFSVIQEIIEALKISYHLQVKRSMGMGSVGSVFALTESGRELLHAI